MFIQRSSLAMIGILLTLQIVTRVPILSGDTQALASSSEAMVSCLRAAQFDGCPEALQFGITQYLPAIFLTWRGLDQDSVVVVLTLINAASFAGILYAVYKSSIIRSSSKRLLFVAFLGSPLLAYSAFSFSESLLSFLLVQSLLFVATGRRVSYIVTVSLVVASRETAFLSTLLLAIAIYLLSEKETRLKFNVLITGVVSGVVLLLTFNFFKFGTWKNVIHSDPVLRTSEIGQVAESFLGLLFSPNGGLVLYWPAAVIVLALTVLGIIRSRSSRDNHSSVAAVVLCCAALLGQLVGLASWYAPFGWVSWGPRLAMPTLVGMVLVCVVFLNRERDKGCASDNQLDTQSAPYVTKLPTAVLLSGALGLILALGFLKKPVEVLSWFGRTDEVCSSPAVVQNDPDYYFRCLNHGMWRTEQSMIEISLNSFGGVAAGLTLGLFLFISRDGWFLRLPTHPNNYGAHENGVRQDPQ